MIESKSKIGSYIHLKRLSELVKCSEEFIFHEWALSCSFGICYEANAFMFSHY